MAQVPRQLTRQLKGRTSRGEALREPRAHTFVRGVGYVRVGDPLVFGSGPGGLCSPPLGTPDLSYHKLLPPGGASPIVFKWMAGAKTWWRHDAQSRRLGYAPEYLSSWGWKYLGPEQAH